jgi:hypothetical protein
LAVCGRFVTIVAIPCLPRSTHKILRPPGWDGCDVEYKSACVLQEFAQPKYSIAPLGRNLRGPGSFRLPSPRCEADGHEAQLLRNGGRQWSKGGSWICVQFKAKGRPLRPPIKREAATTPGSPTGSFARRAGRSLWMAWRRARDPCAEPAVWGALRRDLSRVLLGWVLVQTAARVTACKRHTLLYRQAACTTPGGPAKDAERVARSLKLPAPTMPCFFRRSRPRRRTKALWRCQYREVRSAPTWRAGAVVTARRMASCPVST